MIGRHARDEFRARLRIGEIGAVGVQRQPVGREFVFRLLQRRRVARADDRRRPGLRKFVRDRLADADRAARHQNALAGDTTAQRAVEEEIGIEMALPIVPEPPRVIFQPRNLDAAPGEHFVRLAAVEACRIIDEGENVVGKTQFVQRELADAPERREAHQPLRQRARDEAEHGGVDAQRELRGVRCAREQVQHVAEAHRRGVGQMECAAVEIGRGDEVVERVDDEIDRHDVDAPALEADRRQPLRNGVAQLLDQFEEVVRAIDLVHFAGARVADDDGWTIDAPGHLPFRAHEPFGLVLGAEIGVFQMTGFFEHVLAEHAFVEACRRDRRHVMEAFHACGARKVQRVAHAADIGALDVGGVGGQVVDCGKVDEMIDLALELADLPGVDAELLGGDVALHGDDPFVRVVAKVAQARKFLFGPLAHQHEDARVPARQNPADEAFADESAGARYEVDHRRLLLPPAHSSCLL